MKVINLNRCRIDVFNYKHFVEPNDLIDFVKESLINTKFTIHSINYNYLPDGRAYFCDIMYIGYSDIDNDVCTIWDEYMIPHAKGKMKSIIREENFDEVVEFTTIKSFDLDV